MPILIASGNPHKREEIQQIWSKATESDLKVPLITLADLGQEIEEPVEDQDTFEGNSALKARYYAEKSGHIVIADDSGLEVDALNGAPGVISARYAGATGGRDVVDPANNELLLKNLLDVPAEKRTARFVCAMTMAMPTGMRNRIELPHDDGVLKVLRGTIDGRIIGPNADDLPRGDYGFGYDPLFYLPEYDQTSAQLPPEKKNEISHRGVAATQMWAFMQTLKDEAFWDQVRSS